jgi:alkylation response protein AidB-like acyl-CoA dehydrogenase
MLTATPAVTDDTPGSFRDQARAKLSAACVEIGWDHQLDDPTDIEAQRRSHKALVRVGWGGHWRGHRNTVAPAAACNSRLSSPKSATGWVCRICITGVALGISPTAATLVATAKHRSGDAARFSAEQCLQATGGVGFTWESNVHLYLKAITQLRQWPTAAVALRAEMGRAILADTVALEEIGDPL